MCVPCHNRLQRMGRFTYLCNSGRLAGSSKMPQTLAKTLLPLVENNTELFTMSFFMASGALWPE